MYLDSSRHEKAPRVIPSGLRPANRVRGPILVLIREGVPDTQHAKDTSDDARTHHVVAGEPNISVVCSITMRCRRCQWGRRVCQRPMWSMRWTWSPHPQCSSPSRQSRPALLGDGEGHPWAREDSQNTKRQQPHSPAGGNTARRNIQSDSQSDRQARTRRHSNTVIDYRMQIRIRSRET